MTAFTLRTFANRNEKGRVVRYAPGDVIDVDGDAEIERLVRAGAISLDDDVTDVVVDEPADTAPDADDADQGGDPDTDTVSDASHDDDDDDSDTDGNGPARPRKAGPRDAWIEYAVTKGMARERAESLTKAELIAEVGE